MTDRKTTRMALGLWAVVAGLACGSARAAVTLDKRYFNVLQGFSFRPPAGAVRKHDFSRSRLVSWTGRDEKTGAVAWTLTVSLVAEVKSKDAPLAAYMNALAAKLQAEENFRIESKQLVQVAGRKGIDICAVNERSIHLWQRQVWIVLRTTKREKQFVLFRISGPFLMRAKLAEIAAAVAGSLEVVADLDKARAERAAALKRGQEFLESVTIEDLIRAMRSKSRWYFLTLSGQYAGFVKMQELAKSIKSDDGYSVLTWAMVQPAGADVRLVRREMFTTSDRKTERWLEQWQVGDGPLARNGAETGLKAGNVIVCDVDTGQRAQTLRKENVPVEIYLPRAMGMLLPRLVDLTKPNSYAFATYDTRGDQFAMRTLTVVGPDKLKTAGGDVPVVKVTDQPAEDEEASTLWLTAAGDLVKMTSPDGLGMVATTEAMVLRKYPKAKLIVMALDGKAPPKKPKKPARPAPRDPFPRRP